MPEENRVLHANDRDGAPTGGDSKTSWLLIGAGLILLALAALMFIVAWNYMPAQAAPVEGQIEQDVPPSAPEVAAEKMSRPVASVPSQCSRDGGR